MATPKKSSQLGKVADNLQDSHQITRRQNSKATIAYLIFLMIWTILTMIASQFTISFIMSLLLGNKLNQPIWTGIYYVLTYALTLVLILYVPPKILQNYRTHSTKKLPPATIEKLEKSLTPDRAELGMKYAPTFVDIGLAPIGYVVYIMIANALTQLMQLFPWFNANESQDVGFQYLAAGPDRLIAVISLVFIAPLAEEIIMRGWLYGKMRSKTKWWIAMILTSLVFAFLHGQWNVAVTVFALSLILCSMREITGTIWSGVLLHMLSNGIAFYLLYIAGGF